MDGDHPLFTHPGDLTEPILGELWRTHERRRERLHLTKNDVVIGCPLCLVTR